MDGEQVFECASANQPGIIIRGCGLGQGDEELDDTGTAFLHAVVEDLNRHVSFLSLEPVRTTPAKEPPVLPVIVHDVLIEHPAYGAGCLRRPPAHSARASFWSYSSRLRGSALYQGIL